jgi:hypothetical protein
MNLPSELMNVLYIHRLADESTDECNSNEFKSTYSLVLTNITIYSSVMWNQQIYLVTFIGDTSPTSILGRGSGACLTSGPINR